MSLTEADFETEVDMDSYIRMASKDKRYLIAWYLLEQKGRDYVENPGWSCYDLKNGSKRINQVRVKSLEEAIAICNQHAASQAKDPS